MPALPVPRNIDYGHLTAIRLNDALDRPAQIIVISFQRRHVLASAPQSFRQFSDASYQTGLAEALHGEILGGKPTLFDQPVCCCRPNLAGVHVGSPFRALTRGGAEHTGASPVAMSLANLARMCRISFNTISRDLI
jgi:hypothetical protein